MTDPELARQAEASGPARGDAADPPLPEWDLDDLYPGRESAALKGDLETARDRAAAFKDRYHGKVGGLDGDSLGQAVAEVQPETTNLAVVKHDAWCPGLKGQSMLLCQCNPEIEVTQVALVDG